jgi:deoxyribose-phosphate aldolase
VIKKICLKERIVVTRDELAQMLDVTLVKNIHTEIEIESLIDNARKYLYACVFTLPCYLSRVVAGLDGSGVHAGGTMGFPSGGELTEIKIAETKLNLEMGADELDMVINLGWMRSGKYDAVLDELKRIRDAAQDKPLKCIIEMGCLDDDTAKRACELVVQSGADYVKTGTGWFSPATVEQVRLIKSVVGDDIRIKAAGGIRDMDTVEALLTAGAHRLGIGLASAIEMMQQTL